MDHGSTQKFDNDYDVILCVVDVNYAISVKYIFLHQNLVKENVSTGEHCRLTLDNFRVEQEFPESRLLQNLFRKHQILCRLRQ